MLSLSFLPRWSFACPIIRSAMSMCCKGMLLAISRNLAEAPGSDKVKVFSTLDGSIRSPIRDLNASPRPITTTSLPCAFRETATLLFKILVIFIQHTPTARRTFPLFCSHRPASLYYYTVFMRYCKQVLGFFAYCFVHSARPASSAFLRRYLSAFIVFRDFFTYFRATFFHICLDAGTAPWYHKIRLKLTKTNIRRSPLYACHQTHFSRDHLGWRQ